MDDVMFAHKPRLLDVATQPWGLAINCAQQYQLQAGQRTQRTTFRWSLKVTSQVATTGAESAGYNCLVVDV